MVLDPLRLFLLLGLVLHKGVWEVLERREHLQSMPRSRLTSAVAVIKLAKIAILAGLCVQTVLPDVLPILYEPMTLRLAGALIFAAEQSRPKLHSIRVPLSRLDRQAFFSWCLQK